MAETYATEAKAEGDVGAPLKNPLRNHALAGLADHVRLAQLGQSFIVGICSDTAPPVDVLDGGFSAGGTTSSQKGQHD